MVDEEKIARQIRKGSKEGEKTYAFNEEHDEKKHADHWFQLSEDGLVLFIVLYTQACRWSKCLFCNLPSKCSQFHVNFKALDKQIVHAFEDTDIFNQRFKIRKIIVSNNGSVMDEDTFSSTSLMRLISKINKTCVHCRTICIETRPEYVEEAELEYLKRALCEGDTPTELELAIGFEAFDETLRNKVLKKGLDLRVFEKLLEMIQRSKHESPEGYDVKLKCYMLQKPVAGMTNEQAIDDVKQAIEYFDQMSKKYKLEINMHLNPTFVSAGTKLEAWFKAGEYSPPRLTDVITAVKHGQGKNLSIFVGLYDEGLAVPGGSVVRAGDEELVEAIRAFNQRQDYSLLDI